MQPFDKKIFQTNYPNTRVSSTTSFLWMQSYKICFVIFGIIMFEYNDTDDISKVTLRTGKNKNMKFFRFFFVTRL